MRNPYEVLKIPRDAGMDAVNSAYRELMRKYQEEGKQKKIEELDEAYDAIVLGGASGPSGRSGGEAYSADYSDIRIKIDEGRLDDAQVLLDGIPEENRDAEWFYLKGTIRQKRGWLEEAAKNFAAAFELDPYNDVYREAYYKVENARSGGYRTARRRRAGAETSAERSLCDICSGLLCADCCCECLGGDLIPCC